MKEHGIYFGTNDFYQLIRNLGGQWTDSKERPFVCLIKSTEHPELFWAIPIGNWNHRDEKAQARINKFLNCSKSDIRSCFYHVGNTDIQSIFFISDIIPISKKYIEREYIGTHTNRLYVIKNKQLLSELEYKLKRILSWEKNRPNYFRQHITNIKNHILTELQQTDF